MLYPLVRPLLFAIEAERAHGLTIVAMAMRRGGVPMTSPVLATRVAGLDFPNPLGLAAGADKDARAIAGWFGLGFGAVELGTLTPKPQAGNPRPRLFRLPADRAVINRMGFNNGGQDAALDRLRQARRSAGRGLIGVNVGPNKDAADRVADFVRGIAVMAPVADYLTLNVSSPNTPGLRELQQGGELRALLAAAAEARGSGGPPIFLKIAPDLDRAGVDAVARVALDHGVAALIVSNTTVARPPLRSAQAGEAGGLSGAPLKALAAQKLTEFRAATGGKLPLIAAGGIDGADEAYARIRVGASLVQLYSALLYEGPGLPKRLLRRLERLLRRDGFGNVAEAVGSGPA